MGLWVLRKLGYKVLVFNEQRSSLTCRGSEAMQSIASGLFSLHELHISHLDMKSPNILIASDGRVKIADLGLGKMVKGVDTIVSQLATLHWMAPEVLRGRGGSASDVWAFGTILWEVRLPLSALPEAKVRQHTTDPARSAYWIDVNVPCHDIAQDVDRMMKGDIDLNRLLSKCVVSLCLLSTVLADSAVLPLCCTAQ